MKRILCMVCIFAMVISLCNIAAFASGTEEPIVITTAEQFVEQLVTNKATTYGKVFHINGLDPLGDGILGIDLTKEGVDLNGQASGTAYKALENFYGTIIGIGDGNNIKTNTSVITTIQAGESATFSNLIIRGEIVESSDVNIGALVNQVATADNADGNANVTFDKIINYANITANQTKAGKDVGGILGAATTRNVVITNCINEGNITQNYNAETCDAGGIIGGTTSNNKSITITSCVNKGVISAQGGNAGGIIGNSLSTNTEIGKCANYGAVSVSENATTLARSPGGIVGSVSAGEITGCYNAGSITGKNKAAGIVGHSASTALDINNCFNVGTIKSSGSLGTGANNSYLAYGISGGYNNSVTCSYNIGKLDNKNGTRQITWARVYSVEILCINNYYVGTVQDKDTIGTSVTLVELSKLPAPFNADPWEKNDVGTYYSLPQIKGNTYYADEDDGWYIVATQPGAEFINTQSFSPEEVNDEDYEQYGDYSVVFTKINLTGIEDEEITEFGMYLLDANGNRLATAAGLAGNRIGGVFGILFYGNKFEDGVTYKAEPYIKAGDTEYKGTPVEFQIADAE